jgi:hypothetical protein
MSQHFGNSQIYVLPCLQELKNQSKGIGRLVGLEYEQQPGKWVNNQIEPLFSGKLYGTANASDVFDSYWSGKKSSPTDNIITKKGLLNIPSFSKYGFKNECKELPCIKKWKMYTQFLCEKFNDSSTDNNVALLVTHHNRMRSTDMNQGLLPFNSKKITTSDGEEKSAYANNFCLKIEIQPLEDSSYNINFEVFFPGFPDKGEFKGNCNNNSSEEKKGGGSYFYECTPNNINTDIVKQGIISGLNTFNKKITIYVIRHGNALHNKPVNVSDSFTTVQKRLDSSLTPLGMYQAKILAEKFIQSDAFQNSNVILCCSFLQRTQLTGLLILEAAGILPGGMINDLNLMKSQAITRFKNTNLKIDVFKDTSPFSLKSDGKPFIELNKYYNSLTGSSASAPALSSQGGYKKRRTRSNKRKIRKTKKNKNRRKTRKNKY